MLRAKEELLYRDYAATTAAAQNAYLRRALDRSERVVQDLREELLATRRELNAERMRYLRICNSKL